MVHATIGFQVAAERKIPVRLRRPFRHCCVLPTIQKHFWMPYPTPLGGVVSTLQFSHPSFLALQDLPSASALSLVPLPICPQVIPTLLPSWVQQVLDRHVLFTLLTISNLLSHPDQKLCFSQPLALSVSFFLLSTLTVQFLG